MKYLSRLFSAVLFCNAFLMFVIEPMVGQLLLPLLGGAPVVWNTCVVFFQMMLLAGYAAAHQAATRLRPALQLILLVALQPVAFLVLPLHPPETMPLADLSQTRPVLGLLALLTIIIGVPFFTVAFIGPLVQKWFAHSGHGSARDPYSLYVASNAGSLLALLAYPVLGWLVPQFGLTRQAQVWAVGYGILLGAVFLLGISLGRRQKVLPLPVEDSDEPRLEALTVRRRLRWVVLAFLPSSLMLGVTTYFTTDIAPMPLLWVIPLALYLVTFMVAFARRTWVSWRLLSRALPVPVLLLVLLLAVPDVQPPLALTLFLHLGGFFVAALYCHSLLAQDRPASAHLTDFYLWLAVGGVLGGLFNSVLAPLLFHKALEYPLVLLLIALARGYDPLLAGKRRMGRLAWLLSLSLAGWMALVLLELQEQTALYPQVRVALFLVPAMLVGYILADRLVGFALVVTLVVLASQFYVGEQGRSLYTKRSYFGVLRVTIDHTGRFHQLVHGRTIHGRQSLDPTRRREPLAYYHPSGPAGRIFAVIHQRFPSARIAVIGLGAGDLAGYARPKEQWTFYEIDPVVAQIAGNPAFFTYLADCPAPYRILLGDGRLRLREAPTCAYDVLILDAFSSDAIPTHLLTREALQDYLRSLSPDGLLVMHISNRFLDLRPVLGNLAAEAGLVARYQRSNFMRTDEIDEGIDSAEWVVLARKRSDLGKIGQTSLWEPLPIPPDEPVWTDDSSSVLSALATRLLEGER